MAMTPTTTAIPASLGDIANPGAEAPCFLEKYTLSPRHFTCCNLRPRRLLL